MFAQANAGQARRTFIPRGGGMTLSPKELLLYASCAKGYPLRLRPAQANELNRQLDEIEREKTKKTKEGKR